MKKSLLLLSILAIFSQSSYADQQNDGSINYNKAGMAAQASVAALYNKPQLVSTKFVSGQMASPFLVIYSVSVLTEDNNTVTHRVRVESAPSVTVKQGAIKIEVLPGR